MLCQYKCSSIFPYESSHYKSIHTEINSHQNIRYAFLLQSNFEGYQSCFPESSAISHAGACRPDKDIEIQLYRIKTSSSAGMAEKHISYALFHEEDIIYYADTPVLKQQFLRQLGLYKNKAFCSKGSHVQINGTVSKLIWIF